MNDSNIQVPLGLLYMTERQPSDIGHIIDHVNLELLLYIHVLTWLCERNSEVGGGIVQLNV